MRLFLCTPSTACSFAEACWQLGYYDETRRHTPKRRPDAAHVAAHQGTTTSPRSQMNPATTPHMGARQAHARTHGPAYMRARARPNSRARALPTNRREGGSLT